MGSERVPFGGGCSVQVPAHCRLPQDAEVAAVQACINSCTLFVEASESSADSTIWGSDDTVYMMKVWSLD